MKIYVLVPMLMVLTGCSHFSVNASNCDDLLRNDPNMQNIPQECRDYNEKEAGKTTYPPGEKPIEVDKQFELGK